MNATVVRPATRIESNDAPACLSPGDFETFVRDHAGRLLAVARRLLQSEEDAADPVQDALLSAFASLRTFHGDAAVYTWIYRIVVNVCLMSKGTNADRFQCKRDGRMSGQARVRLAAGGLNPSISENRS